MNKNIVQTKKKLTILFTTIVFFVVLFLGVSFFSLKYWDDLRVEKMVFSRVGDEIENERVSLKSFMRMSSWNPDEREGKNIRGKNPNFSQRGFVNFILIENGEVTTSNIKENISDTFFTYLLHIKKDSELVYKDGFLIKKIVFQDSEFVLFKKIRYTFSDFSSDIFRFILINILFSSILYFIGYKFVGRALSPVEENLRDMRDFVHHAGHEFKTPLSVIDSNVQIMKDTKKYFPEMLDEIKNETIKLNALIDSLIQLSNTDVLKSNESISIFSLVNDVLNDCKDLLSQKQLKVIVDIPKNATLNADKNYAYIFLSNLIGNAIKYNKKKGSIHLSYSQGLLVIEDSGCGISEKYIPKIFDRFYKVDHSRSSEGFGIGLALVKKIADLYHWKIEVESVEKKGTRFLVKIGEKK